MCILIWTTRKQGAGAGLAKGTRPREAAVAEAGATPSARSDWGGEKGPLTAAARVGSRCLSGGSLSERHCPFMLFCCF